MKKLVIAIFLLCFSSATSFAEKSVNMPNGSPFASDGIVYKLNNDGSFKSITSTWTDSVPAGASNGRVRDQVRLTERHASNALLEFIKRVSSVQTSTVDETILSDAEVYDENGTKIINQRSRTQILKTVSTNLSENIQSSGFLKLHDKFDANALTVSVTVGLSANSRAISNQINNLNLNQTKSSNNSAVSNRRNSSLKSFENISPMAKDF